MQTVQIKLYKAVIFLFLAIGLPAFIAGWVVAVNFSGVFETGYKMAFFDIKAAIKKLDKDGQPFFYMNDIKFSPGNFTENTDSENIKPFRGNRPEKKETNKKAFNISYDIRN
ncbi:MAG: hypothetical protein ABSB95_00910 [Dissulfurispiraceae bacterium]|jgi:hypothetical protein